MCRNDDSPLKIAGEIIAVVLILALVAAAVWVLTSLVWMAVTDLSFVEVWQTWFHCLPAKTPKPGGDGEVVATMLNLLKF